MSTQIINDSAILKGNLYDQHTRCSHYHSELDIMAIKFKCCSDIVECYYPCYKCHEELTSHKNLRWTTRQLLTEKVILCGSCYTEMTFPEYKQALKCVQCGGQFNPGCKAHYGLYFEIEE